MIKHLLTELGRIRAGRYLDPRLGRANLNVLDSYISTSNQIFFILHLPLSQYVHFIISFRSWRDRSVN